MIDLIVIGGGLAGCEAVWQAATRGLSVDLYEMRPEVMTDAHQTGDLAEIVCSNSLGSTQPDRPAGLLQGELKAFGSLLLDCAKESALPAGNALAVDRKHFSSLVTEKIENHRNIHIVREEVKSIPGQLTIIASGPLTSSDLAQSINEFFGEDSLFFFDALSPIVTRESIDMNIAFRASRFKWEELSDGDYLNCPFDKDQYHAFIHELIAAKQIPLKDFESQIQSGVKAGKQNYFEGCLPIEVMAKRGEESLAYGPLRPIGLRDPRTNQRPHAVVQLRQDDLAGELFNLVGFQTNLAYSEQQRIFRMIPGLENAEFVRFGQMHRNSFIASPILLKSTLQTRLRDDLFFAGQIAGIEGYLGNIASGLVAGINAARVFHGKVPLEFPLETITGSLLHYISSAESDTFQPMKANFGILAPLDLKIRSKHDRNAAYVERANNAITGILKEIGEA